MQPKDTELVNPAMARKFVFLKALSERISYHFKI
jgi:hypothetical protein